MCGQSCIGWSGGLYDPTAWDPQCPTHTVLLGACMRAKLNQIVSWVVWPLCIKTPLLLVKLLGIHGACRQSCTGCCGGSQDSAE